MLSRIGILSGQQAKALLALSARWESKAPPTPLPDPNPDSVFVKAPTPEMLAQRPKRQQPGKVRLGFIPEEWFAFFYEKLGVTGPYTFGLGLGTYLYSKEWLVMEHEFYNGLSMVIFCVAAAKYVGPFLRDFIDTGMEEDEAKFNSSRVNQKKNLEEQIKNEEQNGWSLEGQLMLVEAKRENVAMQLEEAYRKRLMIVYQEVKRRLDYQAEKENTMRRISHKHLVHWVVKSVISSMTPEQQKQHLDKCIADLALMAKV